MIQRGIGVTIGGLVTLALLILMINQDVPWQDYVLPVAIGAIASWFWPVVAGIWFARRAKQRREQQIDDEVRRQLDQQR